MKRQCLEQFFLLTFIVVAGGSHCLRGGAQVKTLDVTEPNVQRLTKQILHDVAIGATLGGLVTMFLKSENRVDPQLRAAINQIDQDNERAIVRNFFGRESLSVFMENSVYEHDFSLGAIGIGFMTFIVSSVVRGYKYLRNHSREHIILIDRKNAEES